MKIPATWVIQGLVYDLTPQFFSICKSATTQFPGGKQEEQQKFVEDFLSIMLCSGLINLKAINVDDLCELLSLEQDDVLKIYNSKE
jgi:hypothetical protein